MKKTIRDEASKKNSKIPKNLQSYLWSVNVNNLDLDKNKNYIINQILAFGGMDEYKWLFENYKKETIKEVFINKPSKVYNKKTYFFVKNFVLGLKDKDLNLYKYDRDLPRQIRQ